MQREDLKQQLRETGHSVADLARTVNVHYNRLSGALLGYWHLSIETERAIDAQLRKWSAEQPQTNGRPFTEAGHK
jgi:lambda repressor-like predicted transcriptional regulator